MASWLENWFSKKRKLSDLISKYIEQESILTAKKQCFFYFLINDLSYISAEIDQKLLKKGVIAIEVPEAFGFSYFLEHLRGKRQERFGEQSIYLKLNAHICDAYQIALIILNEFGQSPETDPLTQVKELLQNQKSIVILEGIGHLSHSSLGCLLEALSTTKLILVDHDLQKYEEQNNLIDEVLVIPPLSQESAVSLIIALLNYRNDLIITSADRQELLVLAEYCGYLPEVIYLVLSDFQAKETISIRQITDKIAPFLSKKLARPYEAVFAYLWSDLPGELWQVLKLVNQLPISGFSLNDLLVIAGGEQNLNSREAHSMLNILTNHAGLRQYMAKDVIVYQVPHFIKIYLEQIFVPPGKVEQARLDKLLFQRLESHQIWNQPFLWISQLEQTLLSIKRIAAGDFEDRNPYTLLYLQSILMDLGFWREVDLYLVPVCRKTISLTDSNEERGYWYSLLGMIHKGIAHYKDAHLQIDLALESFQRALKFYNPQKQVRKCGFANQNIGSLYFELAQLESNQRLTHLKASIRYLHKAYLCDSDSVTIARQIAQSHMLIGALEKPCENFERALLFYLQAMESTKRQYSAGKGRYLHLQLDLLLKYVSRNYPDLTRDERERLRQLQEQIEGLLEGVFPSAQSQLAG